MTHGHPPTYDGDEGCGVAKAFILVCPQRTLYPMSDPIDELYEKYLGGHSEDQPEERVVCPKCESEEVDRKAGYRGEYKCLNCGHFWQVGGWQAT